MESEKLISHTIQIAGESYPVKLTEQEMTFAREIEMELNEKIAEYKIKFLVKTTKDILAMILLTYAFENKSLTNMDHEKANDRIKKLITRLSDQIG
jgi:cell division protein ZapA (FtsZ GTPase activity inhibitor)